MGVRLTHRLSYLQADITTLDVDAIVNAADNALLGGGGVDGAIHRAAGPGLLEECRALHGCATGDARATGGHNLKARHVIHTVGPIWHGGDEGEAELLASCYRRALAIAHELGCKTIAFPAISTGVYGFPRRAAADIAIRTVSEWLADNDAIEEVVFCCFDRETAEIYKTLLGAPPGGP